MLDKKPAKYLNHIISIAFTYNKYILPIGLILLGISLSSLKAQPVNDTKIIKGDIPEYTRLGVTYLNARPANQSGNPLIRKISDKFKKYPFPDKYDNNNVPPKIFDIADEDIKSQDAPAILLKKSMAVKKEIYRQEIPEKILNKLFNANEEKAWNFDELIQRARYNYSDAEIQYLRTTLLGLGKGSAQYKEIKPFLTSNYILVYSFSNVMDYDEYYDKLNRKKQDGSVEREFRGYRMDVDAFIYKMDFDEEKLQYLFEECWFDENSSQEEKQSSLRAREKLEVPLKTAFQKSLTIYARQSKEIEQGSIFYKSKSQLFNELFQSGMDDVIFHVENQLSVFQVKAPIYSTRPVSIKIGKKEGLTTDDLYLVYEKQLLNGEAAFKRIGAVRVTHHITDNRDVSTGQTEPSRFYQISGKKLRMGHLVNQKRDLKSSFWINFSKYEAMEPSIWNNNFEMGFKFDLFVSRFFGNVHGLKAYIDGNLAPYSFDAPILSDPAFDFLDNPDDVDLDNSDNIIILNASLGLAKEYYFFRNFMLAPYAGFKLYDALFSDSDIHDLIKEQEDYDKNYGIALSYDMGIEFGISLSYKLQIVTALGYSPLGGFVYNSPFEGAFKPERDPVNANISLRFKY